MKLAAKAAVVSTAVLLLVPIMGMTQAWASPTAKKISAGGYSACAVTNAGKVECWGDNSYGQLGLGSEDASQHSTPTVVPGLSNVTSVAVGDYDVCAILSGGGLKCWGYNANGEVGNGTFGADVMSPAQVSGLTSGVTKVSIGTYHACAIVSGRAKCWGLDTHGALGNTYFAGIYDEPQQVTGLVSGVTDISAGYYHSCAVQNAHALCWGYNADGELGTGPGSDIAVPVQVLRHVSQVSAGYYGGCAIQQGAAKCWGQNSKGEAGVGGTSPVNSPKQVSGMSSGVTSIDSNYYFTCAVQNSHEKCWGDNTFYQLGDGTQNPHLKPHQVTGLTSGVSRTDIGWYAACALLNSGTEKCWGWNAEGAVGSGATDTEILTPAKVQLT